jgi:hypothetical protein
MTPEFCAFEDAVAAALANGHWTDELREHAAACPQCCDMQLVSQCLARAVTTNEPLPLPTSSFLWWRAQLAERQQRANRALAAIEIVQRLAITATLIATVAVTWVWKPIHGNILLAAVGLFGSTGVVLYRWVRGRI